MVSAHCRSTSVISHEIVAVTVWPIATQVKRNTASTNHQASQSNRMIVIVAYPPSLVCPRRWRNSQTKTKILENNLRMASESDGINQLRPALASRGTHYGW